MTNVDFLSPYWSPTEIATNAVILLHLAGSLLLGLLVGYERSYHGRAAGMRTYGLVCMASCALTIVSGYPEAWFGGQTGAIGVVDPTRVMQGVVTGIGFLGAGVIMKEGFNISGLTTAASIWAASVIGVLVGVGFFLSAILLTALSAMCMVWIPKLGHWLPSRPAVAVVLRFRQGHEPREDLLRSAALGCGYEVAGGTISIIVERGKAEWHFVAVALDKSSGAPLSQLARELGAFEGVEGIQASPARN